MAKSLPRSAVQIRGKPFAIVLAPSQATDGNEQPRQVVPGTIAPYTWEICAWKMWSSIAN